MTNFTAADMIIHGAPNKPKPKPKKVALDSDKTTLKDAQTPSETPTKPATVKPTGKVKKA
jgi:hypothetical protein